MRKVVCYSVAQHQHEACARFARGLDRHGIKAELRSSREPMESDLAVMWGHRQHRILSAQRRANQPYLVMERGYMRDRFTWTSLGFNGLNGRATFPKINDGLQRWAKNFAPFMKPWRETKGNLAVIMGQCRNDAALAGVAFEKWGREIADKLIERKFHPLFRPHPGDPLVRLNNAKLIEGTLDEALDKAAVVVTYNSNSGVDAVMAGVPTFAQDPGSMVYELSLTELEANVPDREKWCAKMAYTQWLPLEIEKGEAWAALKTVIQW